MVLPVGWGEWHVSTRRAILAHEFAHIRRRDGLTSMLARWITCVFWYHPIAWLVARAISETAEPTVVGSFAVKLSIAGYRAAATRYRTNASGRQTIKTSKPHKTRRIGRTLDDRNAASIPVANLLDLHTEWAFM